MYLEEMNFPSGLDGLQCELGSLAAISWAAVDRSGQRSLSQLPLHLLLALGQGGHTLSGAATPAGKPHQPHVSGLKGPLAAGIEDGFSPANCFTSLAFSKLTWFYSSHFLPTRQIYMWKLIVSVIALSKLKRNKHRE